MREKFWRGEEEPVDKTRREFTKGLLTLLTGCGIFGSGAIVEACASLQISPEKLQAELNAIEQPPEDPHKLMRYLRTGEYLIEDDVLKAYAITIMRNATLGGVGVPNGVFLGKDFLDVEDNRSAFADELRAIGLLKTQINTYLDIFSSIDTIVLRRGLLTEETDIEFKKTLQHERLHQHLKRIPINDYHALEDAAKEITGEYGLDNKKKLKSKTDNWFVIVASLHWEEFYTHLAQGEYDNWAEQTLKERFPRAYSIFVRERAACSLSAD